MRSLTPLISALRLFFLGIILDIFKWLFSMHINLRIKRKLTLSDHISVFLSLKINKLLLKWKKEELFFKNL